MIREFFTKTKSSNNKARFAFIASLSGAFLLIMISTLIPLYKGLVSLVGISLLSVALVIYTKYIAAVYYYDIIYGSDNLPLFVVRQQTGKKYTTLCSIALHEITQIDKETAKQRREHKTPFEMKKYSYLPTIDPAESYRITTVGRYQQAEILIECSEEFAEVLRSYVKEAKENVISNDDEY